LNEEERENASCAILQGILKTLRCHVGREGERGEEDEEEEEKQEEMEKDEEEEENENNNLITSNYTTWVFPHIRRDN
jgi:hypothetical protein